MNYFFCNNIQNGEGALSPEESLHCFKVLRKKEGDVIYILDGIGGEYEAEIDSISKRELTFKVINTKVHLAKGPNIHIVVAPTKNINRIEWLLEKATEVGVSAFTFIECDHSERKVIKLDRLNKIVQGATKQSGNYFLPVLNDIISFEYFLSKDIDGKVIIGYCDGDRKKLKEAIEGVDDNYTIIIGPEGDFSVDEIEMVKAKGISLVTLGETRLRTETAALTALIQLKTLLDA